MRDYMTNYERIRRRRRLLHRGPGKKGEEGGDGEDETKAHKSVAWAVRASGNKR